ncbi:MULTISPECIES: hypothetical protein [unclassified Kitasatospora]
MSRKQRVRTMKRPARTTDRTLTAQVVRGLASGVARAVTAWVIDLLG